MTEITTEGLAARTAAEDRAEAFLRRNWHGTTIDATDAHIRRSDLSDLILDSLEDTYALYIAANAARAALLGEFAREGISEADFATLTGRWFAAFEAK